MPFTGTVLDHLTKPRPDTRFCTGVLRQTYPVARPPVLASIPGVTPARASAPAIATNPTAASTPAAAAAAPSTTPEGTTAGAALVTSSGTAFSSATTAAASPATAAHPSTAAQDPEAATQQYEPAFATQRPSASPNAASRQADQQQGRVAPPGVKDEPGTTDAAKPEPATAHTALKQGSEVEAGSQQQQTSDTPELHSAHQAVTTSSGDVAASNAPALVRQQQQQAQQQSQQQLHAATALPVAAPAAGHGPLASLPAGDPWNALHVAWDSDTPPAWPKLVCPWQVMALARSFLLFTQLTSSLIQDMLFTKECCVCTHSCCVAQVIHAELRHICTMEPHAFVHAFFATCVQCIKGSFVHICVAVSSHEEVSYDVLR